MDSRVFLSYAREDVSYVKRLAIHLEKTGVPVWFDLQSPDAADFEIEIERRINECAAFVVVITPSAAGSKWVRREIQRAQSLEKIVVPLLRSGATVPLSLQELTFVDVRDGSMPPMSVTDLLDGALDRGDGSIARRERSAVRLLGQEDGPARRYGVALQLDAQRERMTPPLPPLPVHASPRERLVALAQLLPRAAERLEQLADRAAARAERDRREAADRIRVLSQPATRPVSTTVSHPALTAEAAFKKFVYLLVGTFAGAALIVAEVIVVYHLGQENLGQERSNPAGDLRDGAVIWALILGFGWLSIGCGRALSPQWRVVERARAAEEQHRRNATQRAAAQRAFETAEQRRQAELVQAKQDKTRQDRQADDLGAFARRCRAAAASLIDPDLTLQIALIIGERTPSK